MKRDKKYLLDRKERASGSFLLYFIIPEKFVEYFIIDDEKLTTKGKVSKWNFILKKSKLILTEKRNIKALSVKSQN